MNRIVTSSVEVHPGWQQVNPMRIIRAETEKDYPAVHRVNELAFPGSNEAGLVDALREVVHPCISLVAVVDGQVVGHIFFSPVSIESNQGISTAMGRGPMGVLPEYQRQGIGSQLVQEGLRECQRIGHDIVVLVGHPEYYPRFGFKTAKPRGLRCEYDVPDEAFMVAELRPGALEGIRGAVKYNPEFNKI